MKHKAGLPVRNLNQFAIVQSRYHGNSNHTAEQQPKKDFVIISILGGFREACGIHGGPWLYTAESSYK